MGRYVVLRLTRRSSSLLFDALGVRFAPGKHRILKGNSFEPPCKVMPSADFKLPLEVGAFTSTNGEIQEGIIYRAKIGRYCSIAKHAKIGLLQHPPRWIGSSAMFFNRNELGWNRFLGREVETLAFESEKDTEVGNDVWIGNGAMIMTGLKIGDGAIVASGAVVTRDVPPYAIVGGAPARVIKYRFGEDAIRELQELQWWRYDVADFGKVDWADPRAAVAQIRKRLAEHPEIKPYEPRKVTGKDFEPYAFRKLFFFEANRERIRIKLFGTWVVHRVRVERRMRKGGKSPDPK